MRRGENRFGIHPGGYRMPPVSRPKKLRFIQAELDKVEPRYPATPTKSPSKSTRRARMKYMLSWFERPQGSPIEYENAQKRILEVFTQWKAPANFKIEVFVIRVGEWGGHMLVDCDDPVTVHKFCSMLPAFEFQARPVIPVEDAVRGALEEIAWRDGLKRKRDWRGCSCGPSKAVAKAPPSPPS